MDYTLSNSLPQRDGMNITHYGIARDVDGKPIKTLRHPDLGCKQFGGPLLAAVRRK
jgi:hypothetical protein